MSNKLDIASELAFYGAYHTNHNNQLVHILFVPLIIWSAFVLLGLLTGRVMPFLAWIAYSAFWIYLDPVVGSAASVVYFVLWLTADKLVELQTKKQGPKGVPVLAKGVAFKLAMIAQVSSWAFQVFVGHAIFEGRKPALLDSMSQAFTMGPLFVVYEALWIAMPHFQADLQLDVNTRIAEMHQNWAAAK